MSTLPLIPVESDVANRMVSSDHSSQGATTYRYNHANQRIYMKTGTKISYFLYGLGGERLLEMEEQCGGNCWNYQETQRWIYFAGRKMFQKTGTTLKAITPNRLASEAKHFPYGETDGTPPADTKDYFATYRRDTTGLDYAWNRYYSPTMGRFTTADPYEASAALTDPQTWNRYAYVANNPVNYYDPPGLQLWFVTWRQCGYTNGDPNCYDRYGYFYDPGSSSGGGGTGGAPPDSGGVGVRSRRQIDAEVDKKWRDLAKKAVESLAQNCVDRISKVLGVSKAQLIQWSQKVHFFEYGEGGKHSNEDFQTATGASPGRSPITIGQYGAYNGNNTIAVTRGYGDSILLDADFRFSGNTDERRMATLTHELIHFAYTGPTQGLTEDAWLNSRFVEWQEGSGPKRGNYPPSSIMSKYIDNDSKPIDDKVY